MNFTSSNFAIGTSGWKIGIAKAVSPQLFIKAPIGRLFLYKFVQRVAYEKIELKDGKDVEIYENLDCVNYDWHGPVDPTTLKK